MTFINETSQDWEQRHAGHCTEEWTPDRPFETRSLYCHDCKEDAAWRDGIKIDPDNPLEDVFQTGQADFRCGLRHYILINRKPSQIPVHVDRTLMHSGCIGHLNGPENWCAWEFFNQEGFNQSRQYLLDCGWREEKQ